MPAAWEERDEGHRLDVAGGMRAAERGGARRQRGSFFVH